jgi:hypothetical protein
MSRAQLALLLVPISLGGCARLASSSSAPLGRPISNSAVRVTTAPAPVGDPPDERNGTTRKDQAARQDTPPASATARTPKAALRRYAQLYTNWQATGLPARVHELATLAIGTARLAAEQIAASSALTISELTAHHVQNTGIVLAIAPGKGPADGQWIVVTQEQTTGTGAYTGLPPSLHLILAQTTRLHDGWTISGWSPQN